MAPLEFSPDQRAMIRDSFANGASEPEFAVLIEVARVRRLNPLLKQIYFVKRWDNQKRREVWSTQVSIDGLRAIAERTGRYDGQDEPVYEYDNNGKLLKCTVKIYRKDVSRPFVGVAFFGEYAQKKKEGGLTQFWAEKPHVMIAKCAEALAFRKGFPEDTSGLYVPEEMGDEMPAEIIVSTGPSVSKVSSESPPETRRLLPEAPPAIDEEQSAALEAVLAKQLEEAPDMKTLTLVGGAVNSAKKEKRLTVEAIKRLTLIYTTRTKALSGKAA